MPIQFVSENFKVLSSMSQFLSQCRAETAVSKDILFDHCWLFCNINYSKGEAVLKMDTGCVNSSTIEVDDKTDWKGIMGLVV